MIKATTSIEHFTELLRYSQEKLLMQCLGVENHLRPMSKFYERISHTAEIALIFRIANTNLAKCTARFFTEVIILFISG